MAVNVSQARQAAVVEEHPSPRGVLSNREFRGITVAQVTSECGDQIASLAIAYLVYHQSNNAFLAAAAYAVTYVPWMVGGILLAPLVDRLPRRSVMLFCDLARAVVVSVLALATFFSWVPIWALIGLVLVSSMCSPPFTVARSTTLPEIFDGSPLYVPAVATGRILHQVDQVFGFALGGLIVAAITPRGALMVDVGTFLASFAVIATHVRPRPAAAPGRVLRLGQLLRAVGPDLRVVVGDPVRRSLVALTAASLVFLIAPEALAVAYTKQQGHGPIAVGLLTAAQPCGVALGAWLFVRYVPPHVQGRWLLRLPVAAAGFLALTAVVPPIPIAALLWMASGASQCFVITCIATYNVITEPGLRGRANGLASAAISLTQGLGFALWGAVGNWQGAAAGVAWAGVAGLLIVVVLRFSWPHDAIRAAWGRLAAAQQASGVD
jgi:Transmembrane secretion effector